MCNEYSELVNDRKNKYFDLFLPRNEENITKIFVKICNVWETISFLIRFLSETVRKVGTEKTIRRGHSTLIILSKENPVLPRSLFVTRTP